MQESDEDDGDRDSGLEGSGDGRDSDERGRGLGQGIKSSWRGERKKRSSETSPGKGRISSEDSDKGKDRLVDIGLDSTIHKSIVDDEPPDDLTVEVDQDDNPPSIQEFRKVPRTSFPPPEPAESILEEAPRPRSSTSSAPPQVALTTIEPPRHDPFWASLYLLSVAMLFASFLLVWLHTYAPTSSRKLGDTVYTALHSSYHLLATSTVVALFVSLFWLAALRSYIRPLVYMILVAVPVILFSFALWPFISSFRGEWHGASAQDKAMRWFSFIPAALSVVWTFTIYKGRWDLGKAISILEFSTKILASNPGLLLLSFATLVGVIAWTWLWTLMFTRVFLGGHFLKGGSSIFVIDLSTWWLGVFFILVYLWTLAVGAGIQRATTAATVSQWYFHRLAVPAPTSRQVIGAALSHSSTTLFGTICFSTLLALMVRFPMLVMPRRAIAFFTLCIYPLLPFELGTLTNPLTLTYAAIHSLPLNSAAQAVSGMPYLSARPSEDLNEGRLQRNRHGGTRQHHHRGPQYDIHTSKRPYTLSLHLLRATRLITSLALGFGAWVNTARSLTIPLPSTSEITSHKGSLYAYVVGLIAAAIGWGVLGAMDGVLTGVVDAVVVCWSSETVRGEGGRYCAEAEKLFGKEDGVLDEEQGGLLRL